MAKRTLAQPENLLLTAGESARQYGRCRAGGTGETEFENIEVMGSLWQLHMLKRMHRIKG
jgi:hypothetical protein